MLFAGANIRYATGSYQGNWKYNINIRYAVVPNGGEPVLFETAGSDLHCAEIDLPWMQEKVRPAITWQWAEGAVPHMADRMARERRRMCSRSTACRRKESASTTSTWPLWPPSRKPD